MLTFFYSEVFLFFALPILLGSNFCFAASTSNTLPAKQILSDNQQKKKHFFLLVKLAKFFLIVCIVMDLFSLTIPNIDTLVFYNGTNCMRYDLTSYLCNLLLTGLTFYFLSLVSVMFARTTATIKYIPEIPFLVLCTLLSLRLFIASTEFFLIIITLEIASFCSIIFLGIKSLSASRYQLSLEATVKYFIINAIAIALFLFSIMGYFYMTTSTNIVEITGFFMKFPFLTIFFAENLLLIQGFFFFSYFVKLGVAPMYQWVPDVYEGAELVVTIFLVLVIGPALLIKGLMFFKVFGLTKSLNINLAVSNFMFFCGLLSVMLGTVNAFYQTRIKRFIAYSSITHLGFLLLGVSTTTVLGYFSFICYLIIYILTNMFFFTLLVLCQYINIPKKNRAIIFITQLKAPLQASLFIFLGVLICCCSFAGIPPFAGFFAKFFVLCSIVETQRWWVLGILIIFILLGTFLYLRFIKIAFFEDIKLSTLYIVIKTLSVTTFYQLLLNSRMADEHAQSTKAIRDLYAVSSWLGYFLTGFLYFFSGYCLVTVDVTLNILTLY